MAERVCFYCGATKFRRVNRRGMFQRYILTAFGWYPWECAICRRKTLRRKMS
jgi:hypothetical protein